MAQWVGHLLLKLKDPSSMPGTRVEVKERVDSQKMNSDGWGPHLHTGTHTNNR